MFDKYITAMAEEIVRQIYEEIGFPSKATLTREIRNRGIAIPQREIDAWYSSQRVNQVFPGTRKKPVHHIMGDGTRWQVDTMYLNAYDKRNNAKFSEANAGYIGLLTFINSSTRYAYAYPIMSRNYVQSYLPRIKRFLADIKRDGFSISSLVSDNEFFDIEHFRTFMNSQGVELYKEISGEHYKLGIINSFHRTLRGMINKYLVYNDTFKWVDLLMIYCTATIIGFTAH
jgi:hypothetical protein